MPIGKSLLYHRKNHVLTRLRSGLGYSICRRLIDEFVATQPRHLCLHLIITTRDDRKSHDTLKTLARYLSQKSKEIKSDLSSRVTFQGEKLDLTSLRSVHDLTEKLLASLPKLDVAILNAGYGGIIGVEWLKATWAIMTDLPYSVTYPNFNINGVGFTTKLQTSHTTGKASEPPLGTVFCSNVFGHYLLTHQLAPLLSKTSKTGMGCLEQRIGRIIWISSLEGYASTFKTIDIQGLAAASAYKSSKRLTDILTLTSTLPSNREHVANLLTPPSNPKTGTRPKMYLSHPGICATSFVPLPLILYYLMTLVFYLARWVGSPWHTVTSYKGACAPVWLALAFQEDLDELEAGGQCKWGSCVNRGGRESVMKTEVEGWGVRGRVETLDQKTIGGRRRGVQDVSEKEREEFEQLGNDCWEQMEGLREDWEKRMGW